MIFVIVVLLLIIALLISMIAKKVSDKEVSEPKQEKTTETKKENKKQQTNLPKVKKINQSGDPYENTVTVSDLDSIYILVNKYSGLPADYEPSDLVQVPRVVKTKMCACEKKRQRHLKS